MCRLLQSSPPRFSAADLGQSTRRAASFVQETGEFRCLTCDHVLEGFSESFEALIRLMIPPVGTLH